MVSRAEGSFFRPGMTPAIEETRARCTACNRMALSHPSAPPMPPIGLFANDVIIIGSVRADWPAPFSVTIGNPRADKLGRNGFECIVSRCSVDRERCVRGTFMHSAIENYSAGVYYTSLTTMVGVSRNKKIRNEIAFHDYLA